MCLFCKIVNREILSEIVYENDNVLAFLDINPSTKGHTLIIPKKHHQDLNDCPLEVLTSLLEVVKTLENDYRTKYQTTSFNLLLNSGKESGQEINHFHFHLIPRYKKGELTIKL